MAYTKSNQFNSEQVRIAAFAKALSHPARVAILEFLMEKRNSICGDIVDQLPLSQSTVSQHLKELKSVNLIKGKIDGPRVMYQVEEENWNVAKQLFSGLFDKANNTESKPEHAPDYYKMRKALLNKISEDGEE